jgi:electron transport complex protein RnfB
MSPPEHADRIDALLPQTQCTKCGYPGCRPYAEAIAAGSADIDQCPPGGEAGVARLAQLLGRPAKPLDPRHGAPGPRSVAWIEEPACIGCTLCIQACPTDAIVGAAKQMHTVLLDACTGCELCVAPCPVDCIAILPLAEIVARGADGMRAQVEVPVAAHAERWRARYAAHRARLERQRQEARARPSTPAPGASARDQRRAAVHAALQRARARRAAQR